MMAQFLSELSLRKGKHVLRICHKLFKRLYQLFCFQYDLFLLQLSVSGHFCLNRIVKCFKQSFSHYYYFLKNIKQRPKRP